MERKKGYVVKKTSFDSAGEVFLEAYYFGTIPNEYNIFVPTYRMKDETFAIFPNKESAKKIVKLCREDSKKHKFNDKFEVVSL